MQNNTKQTLRAGKTNLDGEQRKEMWCKSSLAKGWAKSHIFRDLQNNSRIEIILFESQEESCSRMQALL